MHAISKDEEPKVPLRLPGAEARASMSHPGPTCIECHESAPIARRLLEARNRAT